MRSRGDRCGLSQRCASRLSSEHRTAFRLAEWVHSGNVCLMAVRYDYAALAAFSRRLLEATGLAPGRAAAVANVLLEGDLLGHATHGLALLAPYLRELESGAMAKAGEPRVIADFPAAVTWDGCRLPGPWLTVRAIELAVARAQVTGTCTVVIRGSHHIACLAAYPKSVADRGFAAILACSDPSLRTVAPHGGTRAVFTPNPLAAAWPTNGAPVIFDVSMSITTNGLTNRLRANGQAISRPMGDRRRRCANR